MARFIRINGFTRSDRHTIIGQLNQAISKSGGWILDFKMFSNKSINILLEIPVRNVRRLHQCLLEINIHLTPQSEELLRDTDLQQKKLGNESVFDLVGTLQVTFVHNEPDLVIEVPPFDL
ncbi:MAG: hypothetical protein PHC60_02525 [Heliobacteriaceae bacterium]|nr:hypothetical protein [Heliobacteriaceae bacterium]